MSDHPVWCHVCNTSTVAVVNTSTNELECTTCGGNFVESSNQGIEAFLSSSHATENLSPPVSHNGETVPITLTAANTLPIDQSVIVQQVLERVLGINPSTASISQPIALSGARLGGLRNQPMGIVVRQNFDAVPRNLVGLLQSVANIRQHNLSPDPNALDNAQFENFLHHILMNETSHAGAPPASQLTIESLERETITIESDKSAFGDCCISQEAFEVGDVVISLNCGHKYKEEPITHWLKMHATCPVCRVKI